MESDTTRTVGVKLTKDLLGDIEQHRERMREDNPGMKITVSDAVRSMIKIAAANGRKKR